jgi:predicted transcriptional regulator
MSKENTTDFTVAELAKDLGVSKQTIQNKIRGNPSIIPYFVGNTQYLSADDRTLIEGDLRKTNSSKRYENRKIISDTIDIHRLKSNTTDQLNYLLLDLIAEQSKTNELLHRNNQLLKEQNTLLKNNQK